MILFVIVFFVRVFTMILNSVYRETTGCKFTINSVYNNKGVLSQLDKIDDLIARGTLLNSGKDKVFLGSLKLNNTNEKIIIKKFNSSSLKYKFDYYFRGGGAASRSMAFSCHLLKYGVSVPEPIVYISKSIDKENCESYFVTKYSHYKTFAEHLSDILWIDKDNSKIINSLKILAVNIKKMHDCGFIHGDLGNQNIFLGLNRASSFFDFMVFDLQRGKIVKGLSIKQRALDLSRLKIPSEYFSIFLFMYYDGEKPPKRLLKKIYYLQRRYILFRKSEVLRHPIRFFLRDGYNNKTKKLYPDDKNLWLWDNKTSQPMIALSRKDKNKNRSFVKNFLPILKSLARNIRNINKIYKKNIKESFKKRVDLGDKLGVAIHPYPGYIDHEIDLIKELGSPPVLIRFQSSDGADQWAESIRLVNEYLTNGVKVAVALLQNREAIVNNSLWENFLGFVIPPLHDKVEWFEIGHAINRVKWGIWHYNEYCSLVDSAMKIANDYPKVRFIGPATIDFEWHQALTFSDLLDKNINMYGFSQHLYVDRRGAPENYQGKFSSLEKLAWIKAISESIGKFDGRLIISEFNWPLKGAKEYSPILCPYIPNNMNDTLGVSEETYAFYMIRFIAISLCSGHCHSLYCWRLSAHGYGLVDDLNFSWVKRPAFFAIKFFLKTLGKSTFTHKISSPDNTYILVFEMGLQKIALVWGNNNSSSIDFPFLFSRAFNYIGNDVEISSEKLFFTDDPVYYFISQ
jgi:tRNA A-37 threonylcarbamoyl transferase component Bud32